MGNGYLGGSLCYSSLLKVWKSTWKVKEQKQLWFFQLHPNTNTKQTLKSSLKRLISLRLSVEALTSQPIHLTLIYEKGSDFLITKSSHEWHTLHIIKINAVWLIYSFIKMCICLAWGLALGIHQWLGQADVYIIQNLIFVVIGFSSVVTLYLSKILSKWR